MGRNRSLGRDRLVGCEHNQCEHRAVGRKRHQCEHCTVGRDCPMGCEHDQCEYSSLGCDSTVGRCYSAEFDSTVGRNRTLGCNRTVGRFGSAGVLTQVNALLRARFGGPLVFKAARQIDQQRFVAMRCRESIDVQALV